MTFLAGGLAVAGAVAVLIPILIHLLLRRRRQPVPWAAMRFLLEAIRRQKRRRQIEQFLLLAARCLIVLLAGIALARPVLEEALAGATGSGSRLVVLVIDNSLVSSLRDDEGTTALQRSIETAKSVVDELGPGDAVSVVTASSPANALIEAPSTNLSAVASVLDAIEPSLTPADLPGAIALADGLIDRREPQYRSASAYLLSEFRAGSVNLDQPLRRSRPGNGASATWSASEPATEVRTNVQIVSLEPIRSVVLADETLSDQVLVRLKRHGGNLAADVSRVRLLADGSPIAEPRVIEWSAGQSEAEAQFVVSLPKQSDQYVTLSALIDQDALPADDARYAMIETRRHLRVAMLARRDFGFDRTIDQLTAAQWLNRALSPREDQQLQIVEVDPTALDVRDLRGADMVILPRPDLLQDAGWPMLREFVDAGGMLIITPPEELLVHPWTAKLSSALGLAWRVGVERADLDQPEPLAAEQPNSALLKLLSGELDALAPAVVVSRRLQIETDSSQGEVLLVTQSGKPFVLASVPGTHVQDTPVSDALGESTSADRRPDRSAAAPSRGMIVLFASAPQLDWTTLPAKPLMVPLVQELVRQGVSEIRSQRDVVVGDPMVQQLPASAASLVSPSGLNIPLSASAGAPLRIREPGVARALDTMGQQVSVFAANVNAEAGRTEVQAPQAVQSWLSSHGEWRTIASSDPANVLRGATSGMHLAGILLVALLALVVVETLMARWFSHAVVSTHSATGEGIRPAVAATGASHAE